MTKLKFYPSPKSYRNLGNKDQSQHILPDWFVKYSGFTARRNRIAKAFEKKFNYLFNGFGSKSKLYSFITLILTLFIFREKLK